MKILVAMSGGVDSSVVAHLLKEQGHDLVGVMMKLWVDPLAPPVRRAIPTKCCSIEHIERARSVCKTLGIPFYVHNLENEFKERVVDPFIQDYAEGKTPNPCIICNRTIKFGALLDLTSSLGCEVLATGHYARIEKNQDGVIRLLEAADAMKDQSYYLYALTQKQLARVMFPLGEMQKSEVYALAKRYRIRVPETYRESQDLCFFPEREPRAFLRRYIPGMRPGPIKHLDGRVLGEHEGVPLYTIGQRKGLRIGGLKIPLHVVSKVAETNTIIVAEGTEGMRTDIAMHDVTWISGFAPEDASHLAVRIRSTGPKLNGSLIKKGGHWGIVLDKGSRGISPGQAAVLYNGAEILGGGTIS
ncbi:tRNA 2-thiouridine(34) synthase MnmA [Candidatus Peregrinibacteria bacterium]|nr:tRNA 2-thiouridine(34) synthase MnmA [Candidatus Peregrinibacteria bacterium]